MTEMKDKEPLRLKLREIADWIELGIYGGMNNEHAKTMRLTILHLQLADLNNDHPVSKLILNLHNSSDLTHEYFSKILKAL